MDSIVLPHSISVARLRAPAAGRTSGRTSFALQLPCLLLSRPGCRVFSVLATSSDRVSALRRSSAVFASGTLTANSAAPSSGVYTVGDFMTTKEELHVVGLVSDYDLLALDSISGSGRADNSMFPEVDSTWKTFNEVQKLLSKTNGKMVGDLMTPAPVVVRETTNLEDAARLLLETKYRRLPVVDADGKLGAQIIDNVLCYVPVLVGYFLILRYSLCMGCSPPPLPHHNQIGFVFRGPT
ncbi:CBS domain-containing protein CBSX1 [Citrus sinensis]|uniref:CBS domain-containing protein CBSX1 n=1 Tax=Citrus sinensis TaxID=2711 RepID=A0ACB8J382_CITSI|nr:CBS domain-containing protein CBSX1 [Citrus sinensis]